MKTMRIISNSIYLTVLVQSILGFVKQGNDLYIVIVFWVILTSLWYNLWFIERAKNLKR